MNDDGSKLREAMRRHLDGLQPATPIEQIRQRAHRGRRLMATSLIALVALVAASGAVMLDRFSNESRDDVVAPGPTGPSGEIVFTRLSNDDNTEIMVMNGDGSELRRLAEGDTPAWSPDGGKIAFVSHRDDNPEIYVMDSDGSQQTRLTYSEEPGPQADDSLPAWSPDGTRIAFVSYRQGQGDIFVMSSDGSNQERLAGSELLENAPEWSPDGAKLAFHRFGPDGNLDVYAMDSHGDEITRLTDGAEQEVLPAWSPDGSTIAFVRYENGRRPAGIHLMNADGSNVRELVTDVSHEYGPTWSPDGTRVAFQRAEGTNTSHIYSIDADGTDERQLTFGEVADHSPDWGRSASSESREVATFGRYTFSLQGGFNQEGDDVESAGVVEVNSDHASVCLDSYVMGATSAHLRREGAEPWDYIVIFEIPRQYRPSMCTRGLDRPSLQALIDDPTSYYIEFSNKFTGERLSAPLEIMGDAPVDDEDRQDQVTEQRGRVSCHDGVGDLSTEGSSEQTAGSGSQAPEERQPGTDLTGFSMSRYRDGSLEMNWGASGHVPDSVGNGARLSFGATGSSKEPGYTFAAITATLSNDRWKVLIRNSDDESDYLQTPEVARNVLNLVIEPGLVPRLMRRAFTWRAFSEWKPEGGPLYNDYCPDEGFRRFEGTSA